LKPSFTPVSNPRSRGVKADVLTTITYIYLKGTSKYNTFLQIVGLSSVRHSLLGATYQDRRNELERKIKEMINSMRRVMGEKEYDSKTFIIDDIRSVWNDITSFIDHIQAETPLPLGWDLEQGSDRESSGALTGSSDLVQQTIVLIEARKHEAEALHEHASAICGAVGELVRSVVGGLEGKKYRTDEEFIRDAYGLGIDTLIKLKPIKAKGDCKNENDMLVRLNKRVVDIASACYYDEIAQKQLAVPTVLEATEVSN
jgi:hypothetical protein